MRNDKPRFSKCPWVDLAEIEEGNDEATMKVKVALSFPSSISARSTQRHLLNLGLLQDRLELQDLPKTYSPPLAVFPSQEQSEATPPAMGRR